MQSIGRYQIIEQLGAGAMGAVYKARDPMMDRDVAIKTILADAIAGPQSEEFRERFFREAQAAGRLAHPGIVTVYDVSEHEGAPFLVMEYVAGRTLQSVLQSGDRMEMDRVFDLSIQLAEALDYAHRNGVIHRDIKPANILMTEDGHAKIADFGIARLVESQATIAGQLLGTPAFMAPEQFVGGNIDGRADLFAAGVVIYWMATGDKPFSGDNILAVQYKVVHSDPVPPRNLNPAIPRGLEALILKSIAKDPAERYQSGEDMARDLRALRAGRTAAAPNALMVATGDEPTLMSTGTIELHPIVARSGKKPRGARFVALAFAIVAIAALVVAGVRWSIKPSPPPTPPQPAAVVAPQPPVATPTPPAPKPAAAKAPAAAPKTDKVTLELTATDRTNVIFRAAGQPMETMVMKAAESITLHADKEALITLTNPAAIQAKLNGKPISFGLDRRPGQFAITAQGITESNSYGPVLPRKMPGGPADAEQPPESGKNSIASPARQKELAQSKDSVRLLMKSPALAEFLTLVVRVDDAFFFRHEATAPAPAGPPGGLSMIPLAEERLLPPGAHKIQVSVLVGATRVGQPQELDVQFGAGEHHTLTIQLARDLQRGAPRGPGSLTIKLD